jgi:hypothetical protein
LLLHQVLKSRARADGGEAFTVWDRNIQLAIYSICIYLPCACYETQGNVLVGWTPLVWLIASLHAAGGILVALSVLYSNSITKTVAVCGSLVFTTVLGKVRSAHSAGSRYHPSHALCHCCCSAESRGARAGDGFQN